MPHVNIGSKRKGSLVGAIGNGINVKRRKTTFVEKIIRSAKNDIINSRGECICNNITQYFTKLPQDDSESESEIDKDEDDSESPLPNTFYIENVLVSSVIQKCIFSKKFVLNKYLYLYLDIIILYV